SGEARLPAAAAALFFALAPLNSQPVDFVWARSALLCVTLYLGAFLAFLRRRWVLGAALFALALLTKAIALTLPAMLLIHDFPYTTSLASPRAWLALLVLLAWIGLALRAVRRHPQVTFATAWFFVTLAPESSFAPLAEVVNDHRPYIASSLGLSVLLAWLVERGAALTARPRATFAAVTFALAIAAVPFDRYRTWQWQDALRMWE